MQCIGRALPKARLLSLVARQVHRIRPARAAVTHMCTQQGAGCQEEGRKYDICSSRLGLIRQIRPASPACQSTP